MPAELGAEGGGASPRILRLRLLRRRGRRGPFRSPGDDESRLAKGARGKKREGRELEALPALVSPESSAAPSTRAHRSAAATPRESLAGAHSSSDPTPQPPRSGPNRERSAVPLCQGCPRRRSPTAEAVTRVVTQSATQPADPEKSEEGRKGQRALYRDRRAEVSSSRGAAPVWGPPSSSPGAVCGQVQALPPRMPSSGGECCFSRRFREAGSRRTCRQAPRRGGGVVPWARRAPGKVLLVAPRAGAAQVQLAWARASAKSPGAKRGPGALKGGASSGRGLSWGRRVGRGWSNGEVRAGPHENRRGARAVGSPGPPRRARFPGDRRLAQGGQGAVLLEPWCAALSVPRPPRGRPGPGPAGTIALRLQ